MFLLACCILVVLSVLAPAHGQQPDVMTKKQAVVQVQQQVPGRVLKITDAGDIYRVKLLQKSGRVITVEINKRTGSITNQQEEQP